MMTLDCHPCVFSSRSFGNPFLWVFGVLFLPITISPHFSFAIPVIKKVDIYNFTMLTYAGLPIPTPNSQ